MTDLITAVENALSDSLTLDGEAVPVYVRGHSGDAAPQVLIERPAVPDTITTHESDDQVEPKPAPLPVTQEVIKETVVEKKGGFVPMVLGGAVAAALGYGGAAYVSQDIWPFAAPEDTTFETELREVPVGAGQRVHHVEPLVGGVLDEAFDDVGPDALVAPLREDADACEFTDGVAVVGLVDSDAAEAGLPTVVLVDGDDVVAGTEVRLVQPHLLDVVQ